MGIISWIATLLALVYLYFAIKNKAVCFIFGALSAIFWAYESYFTYHLVFDAGLQAFYFLMSLWGIYEWKYGGSDRGEKPIQKYKWWLHLEVLIVVSILGYALSLSAPYLGSAQMPLLDALTTVWLMAGTLLLVKRELYSWLHLVIADIVYIYIYGMQGAWLFMGLMVLYVVFGLIGYVSWKKTV